MEAKPLLLCWLPWELEVLFRRGLRFAGVPQSLLAVLGEDRFSQNERKGGSKSKFVEINHLSANGNRVSGVAEVLKCTEMHRSKIKARSLHILHCMLKTAESTCSH